MKNKADLQEHLDGGDGGCSDGVKMEAADLQEHHDEGHGGCNDGVKVPASK